MPQLSLSQKKKEIIQASHRLYQQGLVSATSGNLSIRLDKQRILITGHQVCLGEVSRREILEVNIKGKVISPSLKPSSELPLHLAIYKQLKADAVVHAHPPLTNGFFAANAKFEASTFESSFYIGKIEVVPQKSLTVTDIPPVINALSKNRIVVLKNHGVVSISQSIKQALFLIETLEDAVKTLIIKKLFNEKS
jgi:L-fuculose-phosphate aldolase